MSDAFYTRQSRPIAVNYCGAKTRARGTCKQRAMTNGRCRYHGGLSTGPKDTTNSSRNALKHGIYATRFSDEEMELARGLKPGTVDEELCLMRVRLRRVLEMERQDAGKPVLVEVIERYVDKETGVPKERKSKVRDYHRIIDKIVARIEWLERLRLTYDEPGI